MTIVLAAIDRGWTTIHRLILAGRVVHTVMALRVGWEDVLVVDERYVVKHNQSYVPSRLQRNYLTRIIHSHAI